MANAREQIPVLTARQAGLVACTGCGKVHGREALRCTRCGAALSSRDVGSIQRVWAWWLAGLVMYIPANIYPMLRTNTLGHELDNTILGGIVELANHGSWGIAIIVFLASVLIPIGKFIAVAYLAISVGNASALTRMTRHHLHEVVEFIGRWSMLDVFVVAILSALVQFKFVANINPGIAAVSFALSVAFTMLAAQSFDSRLIWDTNESDPE